MAFAILGSTALGLFLLFFIGQSVVEEVVQEVVIEDMGEKKSFGINIGDKAPHFELRDLEGNKNTLTNFLGEPLIITLWTTWNPLSADQIKIFDEYIARDTKPLFSIVTINNQEDKSIAENFIRRGGYKIEVLLDEDGAVGELYKVTTLPLTYFIDKDGVIQDAFTGILSERMLLEKAEKIVR